MSFVSLGLLLHLYLMLYSSQLDLSSNDTLQRQVVR